VTNQPRPPKQRSPLGRYTFFALCLALGGLAVLAVTGVGVSPSAYVALGLAVVGAGLLVGAFLGRARGLIALGIILAMAMPPALIGETVRWDHVRSDIARNRNFDNQTWRPVSFDSVQPSYRSDLGNATLDLTQVDFTGQDGTIDVSAGAGNVKVLLPSTVDTTVTVQNGMGNVTLFGDQQPHGFRNGDESVTNLGSDGTGGGTLNLSINAGMGNVEVVRS
jgi:predicted membrane protein